MAFVSCQYIESLNALLEFLRLWTSEYFKNALAIFCFGWNWIFIQQIHVKIHKYFKNALIISMRYWNISVFDIKCSMRFWNIWIMIFENISENALSNIIGQCAQCVQCVIEINPVLSWIYCETCGKCFKTKVNFKGQGLFQ